MWVGITSTTTGLDNNLASVTAPSWSDQTHDFWDRRLRASARNSSQNAGWDSRRESIRGPTRTVGEQMGYKQGALEE